MKQKLIRWIKIILLTPIVLIWDVIYFVIEKLYKGATWIDKNGGNLIEDIIEDS